MDDAGQGSTLLNQETRSFQLLTIMSTVTRSARSLPLPDLEMREKGLKTPVDLLLVEPFILDAGERIQH